MSKVNEGTEESATSLSIVVTSYGREDSLKRLIESCRREFTQLKYEVVVVSSDPEGSSKIDWLRQQPDVNSIEARDRPYGSPRAKSLYYYENLGISRARGNFILVTNDDTSIEAGTQEAFTEAQMQFDVIVFPTEIDDKSLGKRAPVIGAVLAGTIARPIFLLDFAAIHKSIYQSIGPMDESLDWYGGGVDRGVKCALVHDLRLGVLRAGGLAHTLELENRTPPHADFDLRYLSRKWAKFEEENRQVKILWSEPYVKSRIPDWVLRKVWPTVSRFWSGLRKKN